MTCVNFHIAPADTREELMQSRLSRGGVGEDMFVNLKIGWAVVGEDGGGDGPVSIVSCIFLFLILFAIDRLCGPDVTDLTAACTTEDTIGKSTTSMSVAGQVMWA